MKLFKRKPIIVKGHTFSEYLKRCGHDYINGRGEIQKDKSKLKPGRRYWEIMGEYYQVDLKREARVIFIAISVVAIAMTVFLPIYFCIIAPIERYHDYNFKYWNDAPALKILKDYVKKVVTPNSKNYIPREDRIATFDMDGTLFGERSPIYIEWLMYQDYCDKHWQGKMDTEVEVTYDDGSIDIVTLQETYEQIEDFKKDISNEKLEMNEAYCGAKVFSNMLITEYENYVLEYLEKDALNFNNLKYKDMFYKPMIEVVEFLQLNNFDIYIVSGTDRFMVRMIVHDYLNIAWNKVIGMDVALSLDKDSNVIRTDKLKYKNVKKVKAELIAQEIGNWPALSFGNSSGDVEMHQTALNNPYYPSLAFMNVADDTVRERGYEGKVLEERIAGWKDKYQLFSMKNDWKTIYGDNVTLKK